MTKKRVTRKRQSLILTKSIRALRHIIDPRDPRRVLRGVGVTSERAIATDGKVALIAEFEHDVAGWKKPRIIASELFKRKADQTIFRFDDESATTAINSDEKDSTSVDNIDGLYPDLVAILAQRQAGKKPVFKIRLNAHILKKLALAAIEASNSDLAGIEFTFFDNDKSEALVSIDNPDGAKRLHGIIFPITLNV